MLLRIKSHHKTIVNYCGGGTRLDSKSRYPCDITYEDKDQNQFIFKTTAKAYEDMPRQTRLFVLFNKPGVKFVAYNGKAEV